MGQKQHKKLRKVARLMADTKVQMYAKSDRVLLPPSQKTYRDPRGATKNNPITERGTIRWLKKQKKQEAP